MSQGTRERLWLSNIVKKPVRKLRWNLTVIRKINTTNGKKSSSKFLSMIYHWTSISKYYDRYDESDADIKLFSVSDISRFIFITNLYNIPMSTFLVQEEYATSEDSGKLKPTTLTNPKGPLPATLSAQREATITSSANENASLKETIIVLDKMLRWVHISEWCLH